MRVGVRRRRPPRSHADDSEGARPGSARRRAARPLPDQPDASGDRRARRVASTPVTCPSAPGGSALLTVAAGVGALVFPTRRSRGRRRRDHGRVRPPSHDRDRARTPSAPTSSRVVPESPWTLEHGGRAPRHLRRRVGLVHGHPTIPTQRTTPRAVGWTRSSRTSPRVPETTTCGTSTSDCPTTVQGELALKALEFAQTGMHDAERSARSSRPAGSSRTAATRTDALPVGLSRGREGRGPHVSRLRARVRDGARRTQAQVAHHAGAEGVSARNAAYARDSFLFTRSPRASARLDPTESDRPHPRPARRASTLARPVPRRSSRPRP